MKEEISFQATVNLTSSDFLALSFGQKFFFMGFSCNSYISCDYVIRLITRDDDRRLQSVDVFHTMTTLEIGFECKWLLTLEYNNGIQLKSEISFTCIYLTPMLIRSYDIPTTDKSC